MPRPKLPRTQLMADFEDAKAAHKVHQLSDKRDRVGVSYDEAGGSLIVRFREPTLAANLQTFDLSHWLSKPLLALPFAQAFYIRFADRRPATRQESKASIDDFLKFLPSYEKSKPASVTALKDLSQTCVTSYLESIENRITPHGTPLKLTTISNLRGPLRSIFQELQWMEHEGCMLPPDLDFPTMGKRGRKQGIEHIAPLDDITLFRTVVGAISDIEKYAREKPISGFPVDSDGHILSNLTLDDMLKRLNALSDVEAAPLTFRESIPFCLLLGLTSSFNVSSIVGAPQTALIKYHPLFGLKRWMLQVLKYRPKPKLQKRSFSVEQYTWANPVYLLAAVEVYTRSIRQKVANAFSDRMFLAVHSMGPSPLSTTNDGLTKPFDVALREFCFDHKLEPFTLQQLRPTSSEVIHTLTEGDVSKQHIALQHSGDDMHLAADTYTSAAAVQRDTERLAKAMVWREVFVRSRGKSDARIAMGSTQRALRAATPGFACMDLFDSPYAGQKKGVGCSAYCMCPSCPMGAAMFFDPYSAARLLQVEQKLVAARSTISNERWSRDYASQLEDLQTQWLPLIKMTVRKRAEALNLPDIPAIE
jgi:hypothetical protein